jgi:hypothetical protein
VSHIFWFVKNRKGSVVVAMLLALRPEYRSAMRFSDVRTLTGNIALSAQHSFIAFDSFLKTHKISPDCKLSSHGHPRPVCYFMKPFKSLNHINTFNTVSHYHILIAIKILYAANKNSLLDLSRIPEKINGS